jgi:hypothetical protein
MFVVLGLLIWSSGINPEIPKFICGLFISFFGVFVFFYGDKRTNVDGGRIGRLFFPPNSSDLNSKLQKVALGLLFFCVGAILMLSYWGF